MNESRHHSNRIPPSPNSTISGTQSYLHPHSFSTSSSTLTTQSTNQSSRHSWMNDSDMEVDEELPNLSVNIEKAQIEKLTKKEMKIQEVINELIHTEQKHVRNLKIMKHHFYIPIKVEMYLNEEERKLLFPNLEEVLELHSTFNNKLKDLRKENVIVPIKELINVILEQFQGEQGNRFQNACATFCQNQGEAMKLLQTKMKTQTDKFNLFLNRAENDQVCRKLHLKDFIPTEVQRLVKYRLLFHELTKNASDEEDINKLTECMDASSKISLFVNKAVTECENRKRTNEIQSRMDTKEFDQYCTKSPLLAQYKNLEIKSRKLIYEGELEWKMNGSIKLMALLFEDILVFLERERSMGDDKRRYILRPLFYTINKTKLMFTPVIPLTCINSFSAMHEKRNFHLVVIIDDNLKAKNNKSEKVIQTQMLFIFVAKSGDERNKCIIYLQ
jgi:Rho guanine nucleotide exchange factor 12